MTLKVTTEPREERQLAVKIEVPQERVDQELRKAAAKVSSEYRLPGFRKGKAPYHIVVQQFGIANLYGEFVDKLGEQVYKEALLQEKIEPYAQASLEDVAIDPLIYTLVVPLEPLVDLGDYRALRVERDDVVVDEARVDEKLEGFRSEHANWQTIDGPSAYGDMLTIDVKSIIAPVGEGDEPTVVLDETDWDVTPDEEHPMDPPGFDAALLGMTPGETKEFVLSWPAESRSIHAGKEATFTVNVKQIQRFANPALDDAFAALVNPDVTTIEELRAQVRDELMAEATTAETNAYGAKALDAFVALATLEYPPAVVEDQLDNMIRDYEQQLRQLGIEDLNRFFEQTGQSLESFRDGLREQANMTAQRNLVLSEIIRAEQLRVSDEEIEERIVLLTEVGDDEDEAARERSESLGAALRSDSGLMLIANEIIRIKAMDRVLAIARGDELPELSAPENVQEVPVLDPESAEDEVDSETEAAEDEAEGDAPPAEESEEAAAE